MSEKLVEARRLLEKSDDTSAALGLLALKGAIDLMLEYLEEAEEGSE